MPQKKIPDDAILYYIALGPGRSYQRVADHYGVSKRAVVDHAARENWTERMGELESQARDAVNEKSGETLEAMNERHLKTLRVIQAKALEALKTVPLDSAINAVRALESSIKQERLIRGEPSERTAFSVEETIRREYERWMVSDDEEDEGDGVSGPCPSAAS